MDTALLELVRRAKSNPMTAQEAEEQRLSFAYGNTNIENPRITREMISTAATKLATAAKDRPAPKHGD